MEIYFIREAGQPMRNAHAHAIRSGKSRESGRLGRYIAWRIDDIPILSASRRYLFCFATIIHFARVLHCNFQFSADGLRMFRE